LSKQIGKRLPNIDHATVADFGDEWTRFDQRNLPAAELDALFDQYFKVFPWESISHDAEGFDMGCGSGRWAARIAKRVGVLHCVDASEEALVVARRNLSHLDNCVFHHASVDSLPLKDASMDFGCSLGVLHHVPDTAAGIEACVRKLKPGAPFLLYLYYDFEGRPRWFRLLWRATDLARRRISRLPRRAKVMVTTVIASLVYLPAARLAKGLHRLGRSTAGMPLAQYKDLSFYTMRTDALDRFGTRLEKRFSRKQIDEMMRAAGLTDVRFSESVPFWCAVGYRGP
jgi:ubiquinone/menaquinone biosynthesis C-methylase UbiE